LGGAKAFGFFSVNPIDFLIKLQGEVIHPDVFESLWVGALAMMSMSMGYSTLLAQFMGVQGME
jgi:hypothetical protein